MAKGGTMHRWFPRWFKPTNLDEVNAALDASLAANRVVANTASDVAQSLDETKELTDGVVDETGGRIKASRSRKAQRLRSSRRIGDAQAALSLLGNRK